MTLSEHRQGNESESIFFMYLLGAIALQTLNVLAFSEFGRLAHSWVGSLLIGAAAFYMIGTLIAGSSREARKAIASPWRTLWPYLFILGFLAQIIAYPPMMHDSLSYRLPRIFLALQEGGMSRIPTADQRMNYMPWGWESLALPFAALNHISWSRIIGIFSWAIIYHLCHRIVSGTTWSKHATLIALALTTSPFFVLQATSTANDLYAASLLMVAAWMYHEFRERPSTLLVMAPLLAIVLAANVKPQFILVGAIWLAWFVLDPRKPWKSVDWRILLLAIPVFTMVSPVPWLLGNLFHTGALTTTDGGFESTGGILAMMAAGALQFVATQFQLPVFPMASAFNRLLRSFPGMEELAAAVPKFSPGVSVIPQIDNASFGLVGFILFLCGVAGGIIIHRRTAWIWLAAVAAVFMLAASQVVPSTIGRSYAGFVLLLFPLACVGLASFGKRFYVRPLCLLSIAGGAISTILNPSAPLWPASTLRALAEQRNLSGVVRIITEYTDYRKRAETGTGILGGVPRGENIGVMLRGVTPVAALWQPDWRRNRFDYVNDLPVEDFLAGETKWLLVAGKSVEFHPDQFARYSALPGWSVVSQREYLPNITQGPDTWILFHRNDSSGR